MSWRTSAIAISVAAVGCGLFASTTKTTGAPGRGNNQQAGDGGVIEGDPVDAGASTHDDASSGANGATADPGQDAGPHDAGQDADDKQCKGDSPDPSCRFAQSLVLTPYFAGSADGTRRGLTVDYAGWDTTHIKAMAGVGWGYCDLRSLCRSQKASDFSVRVLASVGTPPKLSPGKIPDQHISYYYAPALHWVPERKKIYASLQLGVDLKYVPWGRENGAFGVGARLFFEPATDAKRVVAMFGLGITLHPAWDAKATPRRKEESSSGGAESLEDTLAGVVASEASDVALGDPRTVEPCPLAVGGDAANGTPLALEAGDRCKTELFGDIPGQTCATILLVGKSGQSINARLLASGDKSHAELLVEDLSATNWPILMYCNAASAPKGIVLKAWAPGVAKTHDIIAARYDAKIPWELPLPARTGRDAKQENKQAPKGAIQAKPTAIMVANNVTVSVGTSCNLVQFVHGGDSVLLKFEPPARAVAVSVPWYVQPDVNGTRNDDLRWTTRTTLGAPGDATTSLRLGTQTGGPAMVCPIADDAAPEEEPAEEVSDAGAAGDAGENDAGADGGTDAGTAAQVEDAGAGRARRPGVR